MDVAISTLLSPIILFFALGMGAALLRSQMSVPEAFAKGLAIYLMMAIGLKGGVEMSKNPMTLEVILVLLAGIVLSFLIPAVAYFFLRVTTKLSGTDAAATAAHYGSISIVTFVAATEAVRLSGLDSSGHMVAVAALMETPAIVTALLLASRGQKREAPVAGAESGELVREVALNASIVVLVGALVIGWIAGEEGTQQVQPFFVGLFQGVLCLFLLDMGLSAGRGLRQGWRDLSVPTVGFGLYMPLVSAAIATPIVLVLGMGAGDAALLITLAASASYIAVPAAMRLALPKANPSIYLTLSLGVTFPFNVTLGIPIYIYLAGLISGQGG
ncbi:MAG: sodium-dependent bicarbonate transport family permease [Pseudomonadota bacterium]